MTSSNFVLTYKFLENDVLIQRTEHEFNQECLDDIVTSIESFLKGCGFVFKDLTINYNND